MLCRVCFFWGGELLCVVDLALSVTLLIHMPFAVIQNKRMDLMAGSSSLDQKTLHFFLHVFLLSVLNILYI